jgi:hypothetical protein
MHICPQFSRSSIVLPTKSCAFCRLRRRANTAFKWRAGLVMSCVGGHAGFAKTTAPFAEGAVAATTLLWL